MTQATLNGNTYSDDGTAARDMTNGGHRTWLLPMLSDGLTGTAASASAAASSASAASSSASAAASSAAALTATSTTSNSLSVASKTWSVGTGKQFAAGVWVFAVRTSDTTKWASGQVTSYAAGSLVVNVVSISGAAGPYTDWTIYVSGPQGVQGATGSGVPATTAPDAYKMMRVNSAGSGFDVVAPPFRNVQIFTSSGTFTPDAAYPDYFVIATASGGSGAKSSAAYAKFGGQAGQTVFGKMAISAAQTVTIGAAGAAKTSSGAGNTGSDVSVGTLLVAKGGVGGPDALTFTTAITTLGTVPTGCVGFIGGIGYQPIGSGGANGSLGGSSYWGGVMSVADNTAQPTPGYGCGGASSTFAADSGAGGAGIVIFMW